MTYAMQDERYRKVMDLESYLLGAQKLVNELHHSTFLKKVAVDPDRVMLDLYYIQQHMNIVVPMMIATRNRILDGMRQKGWE